MSRLKRLLSAERGAALMEFAFAAPLLITIVIAVAQLGIMYSASTGVHHAVEEGARLAAVFPTPTDDQIRARVVANRFMLGTGTLTPAVSRGTTADGDQYVDVSLSYAVPVNFIFFSVQPITVQHSRRVFRQT
jgi:Flp pilus assembly protein TadG